MTRKKVLHIGAEGMLGSQLGVLLTNCKDLEITSTSHRGVDRTIKLDITKFDELEALVQRIEPDLIFNTTAYTNVDLAETEPELANLINGECVGALANAAAAVGAYFMHISTDYVFSGEGQTPWLPTDSVGPTSVYGHSKLLGEALIQKSDAEYAIIRTAWLYGINGNHFIKTILSLAEDKDNLKIVSDQIGSPTNTFDLAKCMIDFGLKRETGIFHFCNQGQCSWFDFASYAVGLKHVKCDLEKCSTDEFPRPAQRPSYSVLNCSDTYQKLSWPIRTWQEALEDYLTS